MDLKTSFLSALPTAITARLLRYYPHAALRIRGAVSTMFHMLYHSDAEHTWMNTYWRGVPVWKCPLDLWIYQEIIFETKPDVIIEAGTKRGGSAYFFASLFDMMQHGRVLTIDVEDLSGKPQHERISYFRGSSTSEETISTIRGLLRDGERVMVSLDSEHSKTHVLNELRAYGDLVTIGNYLVVEDTNLNGHPVWSEFGPGPNEAIDEFLRGNSHFVRDRDREKFILSFNPGGYLKRISANY